MSGKRLATAAAFCVLAAQGALAQKAAPAERPAGQPCRRRARPAKRCAMAAGAARQGPASRAAPWSPQEIELAQARCAALLKGLDVVAVPEVPLREGGECGRPRR